jgi:hypothetical protein
MGKESHEYACEIGKNAGIFSGFFGPAAGRAWHRLLITSKIGVLELVKDAPASKEFS